MPKMPLQSVPAHVGFIMDGNRRWAREKGMPPMKGHEAGVDAFYTAVRACIDHGVSYITAYTFSIENWKRAEEEVSFLMALVPKVLRRYLKEFHKDNIKIAVLGSREGLSKSVIKAIDEAEETTKNNTKGTVALCFNYGARNELLDMIKNAVHSGADIDKMSPDDTQKYLYHPEIPQCDLVVRVSGEKRLSGFMLPRCEYAEFIFDDIFWPDVTKEKVVSYLVEYSLRQRRFGA